MGFQPTTRRWLTRGGGGDASTGAKKVQDMVEESGKGKSTKNVANNPKDDGVAEDKRKRKAAALRVSNKPDCRDGQEKGSDEVVKEAPRSKKGKTKDEEQKQPWVTRARIRNMQALRDELTVHGMFKDFVMMADRDKTWTVPSPVEERGNIGVLFLAKIIIDACRHEAERCVLCLQAN